MLNMPGFTAKASLYGANERYVGRESQTETTGSRAVIPQFCYTVGICVPILNKKLRVCCGWTGCSTSWVPC